MEAGLVALRHPPSSPPVRAGLDMLEAAPSLVRGLRVGLCCNGASITGDLRHAVEVIRDLEGVTLGRVFAPEHGLWSTWQDMVACPSGVDPVFGVEVVSLYGATEDSLTPVSSLLADLDAVIVDLQDVGARYYTYAATLFHLVLAARTLDVTVVVLDRPNPLGGLAMEGPLVHRGFESFVGRVPIPVVHGMTMGELARMYVARYAPTTEVVVVPMDGWQRWMRFDDTGLPWVAPSPNMPRLSTAMVYPGMCLVEGTDVSEGRGTTRPFELIGAPWVDAVALVEALARRPLPGLGVRPTAFLPMFGKHAGEECRGVALSVTDREFFRPFRAGLGLLQALLELGGERFTYRREAYEFVEDVPAIDLLLGSGEVRPRLEAGEDLLTLEASWQDDLDDFGRARGAWLVYEP